jgi:hypothetical protein
VEPGLSGVQLKAVEAVEVVVSGWGVGICRG